MRKVRETLADRIWKEKLDECASTQDSIVLLSLLLAVLLALLVTGW
jgi:hypothetical protein